MLRLGLPEVIQTLDELVLATTDHRPVPVRDQRGWGGLTEGDGASEGVGAAAEEADRSCAPHTGCRAAFGKSTPPEVEGPEISREKAKKILKPRRRVDPGIRIGDRNLNLELSLPASPGTLGSSIDEIDEDCETDEIAIKPIGLPKLLKARAKRDVKRRGKRRRPPDELPCGKTARDRCGSRGA
jgi:hypothetical protein